jgi:hypothetical protein
MGETFEVDTTDIVRPQDPNTLIYEGSTDWGQTDEGADTFVVSFGCKELTVHIRVDYDYEENEDDSGDEDNNADDSGNDGDNNGNGGEDDSSEDELNEGVNENLSKEDMKCIVHYSPTLTGDKNEIPKEVKKIRWSVSHGHKVRFTEVCLHDEPEHFAQEGPTRRYTQCFSDRHVDGLIVNFEVHVERNRPKQSVLHKGIERLLKEKCLTDAKLVCGRKEIACHKVVLAALSPVFKNQLSGGRTFRESRDAKIKIADFTFEEVEVALSFLYNNDARCIEGHAKRLLLFADKYDIPVLSTACEKYLASTICQPTAIRLLKLAIESHSDFLKSAAVKFIGSEWFAFKNSEELKEILKGDADLATEMCFSH